MVTIQGRNLSRVNISITALFMLAEVLPSLNCGIHPVLCFSQNKHPTFWADIPWYNVLLPWSEHAGNVIPLLCQQATKWSPFLGFGVLFPSAFPAGGVLSVGVDPVPARVGLLPTQTLLPRGRTSHHPLTSENTP